MSKPVTLVTGASRGIGRAIAARLARDGHQVINLSRSDPGADFPGVTYTVDLGNAADTARVLTLVTEKHGIDNVVNNAAMIQTNPIERIGPAELQLHVEINLRAVMQVIQAVLPAMRARRRGRIVNIGSRAALGKVGRSSYAATKAAIVGLTRTLALELGPDGITVNVVAPGPIETDLFRSVNPTDSATANALIASVPIGRIGTPEDVAAAVAFFVSDDASYITGQVLNVCGGLSVGSNPL